MKLAVKKLSQLLGDALDVPVFEHTLPEGYAEACVVVAETSFDAETSEGEYAIHIYAPNEPRTVGEIVDNSCPDMDTLEGLSDVVVDTVSDLWDTGFNGWVRKRQLVSEGTMHYFNISLTIQFD